MHAKTIMQHVTRCDDGYMLEIAVNEQCCGVNINSVTMYMDTDDKDSCTELAVNWDSSGLNNCEEDSAHMLLMRNINSTDDATAVMHKLYFGRAFNARLRKHLCAAGFSASAAAAVTGSEWGMQDVERASYDAYDVADELYNAITSA